MRQRLAKIKSLSLDPVAVHTLDKPDVGAHRWWSDRAFENALVHDTRALDGVNLLAMDA